MVSDRCVDEVAVFIPFMATNIPSFTISRSKHETARVLHLPRSIVNEAIMYLGIVAKRLMRRVCCRGKKSPSWLVSGRRSKTNLADAAMDERVERTGVLSASSTTTEESGALGRQTHTRL